MSEEDLRKELSSQDEDALLNMDFDPHESLKIIFSREKSELVKTVTGLTTSENTYSKKDVSEVHKYSPEEEISLSSLKNTFDHPQSDVQGNLCNLSISKSDMAPKVISSVKGSCVDQNIESKIVTHGNTSESLGSCHGTPAKSAGLLDSPCSIQASLAVAKEKNAIKNVFSRKDPEITSETDSSNFSKVSHKPKESPAEDLEDSISQSALCSSSSIKADLVKDCTLTANKVSTSRTKSSNLKTSKVTFDSLQISHSYNVTENILIKTKKVNSKNKKLADDISSDLFGNKNKLFSNPNWLLVEEQEKFAVKSTSDGQRKKKTHSASSNKSISIPEICGQVQKKTSTVPSETSSICADLGSAAQAINSGSKKIDGKEHEKSPKKIIENDNCLKSNFLSKTSRTLTDHPSAEQYSNVCADKRLKQNREDSYDNSSKKRIESDSNLSVNIQAKSLRIFIGSSSDAQDTNTSANKFMKIGGEVFESSQKKIQKNDRSPDSNIPAETLSSLADLSFVTQDSDAAAGSNNKPSPKQKLSLADYLRRSSVKSADSDVCADSDSSTDTCSACSLHSQSKPSNDNFAGFSWKKNRHFHESRLNTTQSHSCIHNEILTDTSFEKVMSDASSKHSSSFSFKFLSKDLIAEKLDFSACNSKPIKIFSNEDIFNNNCKSCYLGAGSKASLDDNFRISSKQAGDAPSKLKAQTPSKTSSLSNNLSISHKKFSSGKNLTVLNKHLTAEVAPKPKAHSSDNNSSSGNNLAVGSKHSADDFLPKVEAKMTGDRFSSSDNFIVFNECSADNVSTNLKMTLKIPTRKLEKRKMQRKHKATEQLKRSKVEEQKRRWTLHKTEFKVSNEEIISKKLCRLRYRISNDESFVNKLTLRLKTFPDFAEITDFTLPQFRYGLPDCERSLNVIYMKIKERNNIVSSMKQLSMLKNHFPKLLGLSVLEHKKCQSFLNGTFINIKEQSRGKAEDSKSSHQASETSINLPLPHKVRPDEKLKKTAVQEKKRFTKHCNAAPSIESVSKTCNNNSKSVLHEKIISSAPICEGDESVNDKENKNKFNECSSKKSSPFKVLPLSKTSGKDNQSSGFSMKFNNMNGLLEQAFNVCKSALKRNLEVKENESRKKKFKADPRCEKDSDGSSNDKAKEISSSKSYIFEKCQLSRKKNIKSPKHIPEITLDESSSEDSDDDSVLSLATSDILPEDCTTININVDGNTVNVDLNNKMRSVDIDNDMDISRSPTNTDGRNLPNPIDSLDTDEYYERTCNSKKQLPTEPIIATDVQLEIKNLCKPASHKNHGRPESTDIRSSSSSRCESNLVQIVAVSAKSSDTPPTQFESSYQEPENNLYISNPKVPSVRSGSPDFQAYQSVLPRYDNFSQYQSFLPSINTNQTGQSSLYDFSVGSPRINSPDFQMYQSFFSSNRTFSQYQSYLSNNHLGCSTHEDPYSSFDIEPLGKSHPGDSPNNNDSSHQKLSSDNNCISNKSDSPAFQSVNFGAQPSYPRGEGACLSSLKVVNDQKNFTEGSRDARILNTASLFGYMPSVFVLPSSLLPGTIDPQINKEPGAIFQFVDGKLSVQLSSSSASHNVPEYGNLPPVGEAAILLPSKTSCNISPSPSKEISCSKTPPLINESSTSEIPLPAKENFCNEASLSEDEVSRNQMLPAYQDLVTDIIQISKDDTVEAEIRNDAVDRGIPSVTKFGVAENVHSQKDEKISWESRKFMQTSPLQSAEEPPPTVTEEAIDRGSFEDNGIKEAEKRDHLNPEWDYWKRLTNDKDRYKNVRMAWKNLRIPNPKVNLTVRNSQKHNGFVPPVCELQGNIANQEVPTISCDNVFVDQVAENMQKLEHRVNSLQDDLQYELQMQCINHENTMRNCPNPALIPDLKQEHFKLMHKTQDYFEKIIRETRAEINEKNERLRQVCSEVVSFHNFYDDLDGEKPEYSTRLTLDEYEEIKEINLMLESYNTFYK